MELNKIPALVVGLVVAILIVTVVAIPIIDDASSSIKSTENNTNYRFVSTSDITDTVTVMTKSDNSGWTVNGTEFTASGLNIISDGLIINATGAGDANISVFKGDSANTLLYSSIKSIVFENGTWTITKTSDATVTGPYSFVIYPSNDGSIGYFWGNKHNVSVNDTYFVKTSSTFYTGDDNSTYSANMILKMVGNSPTFVSGFISYKDSSGTTTNTPMTSSMIKSVTGATLSEDRKSYSMTNVTIELSYTIGSVTTHTITSNTMFSPISYDYISENDSSIIKIIDIIPILLIVSMLIAIVGTVFIRTQ